MNAVFSIIILIAVIGLIIFLLSRRENTRRSQYGPAGLSEFRTDLPLDDCFDRLDQHTKQPLDTLYTLRLDPGRQTVVTLIFIREAFGYQEPLFPPAMLDEFLLQKLEAHRTK